MAFSMLQSLVLPALRTIQVDLNATQTATAWIVTAYLVSGAVLTPIAGRIGDMYGKKRTLVVVLAVLCLGTTLSAVARSIDLLIVGRVIQGIGGAIFPLAFGIIRDEFPPLRRAGAIGVLASVLGLGG